MKYSPDDQVVLDALTAAYPEAVKQTDAFFVPDSDEDNSVWGKLRLSLETHGVFGKGRHAFAGAHQLQLHPSMLSRHINRALRSRGPEDTLRWLHDIFTVEQVVSRQCAELLGAKIDHAMDLANGVQLLPFANMRSSWHADQLKYLYNAPRPLISTEQHDVVGMIQTVTVSFSTDLRTYRHDYSAFSDIALGITVAADAAPVVGVAWSEYEDTDLADAEMGWSHMPRRYEGRPPQFQTVDLGDEHALWIDRFLSLSGTTKRACAIAAGRLNSARRRIEPGDSAIDIATALEALLATSDEKAEITYRLRLRAALLLGTHYQERLEISNRMNDLYKLRSKVVHGDNLAATGTGDRDTVEWGKGACHQLLRLVVQAGRLPDLKKLEFTGDPSIAFA